MPLCRAAGLHLDAAEPQARLLVLAIQKLGPPECLAAASSLPAAISNCARAKSAAREFGSTAFAAAGATRACAGSPVANNHSPKNCCMSADFGC
jgi:hypothetical protein